MNDRDCAHTRLSSTSSLKSEELVSRSVASLFMTNCGNHDSTSKNMAEPDEPVFLKTGLAKLSTPPDMGSSEDVHVHIDSDAVYTTQCHSNNIHQ
jgi:hypothetical protein